MTAEEPSCNHGFSCHYSLIPQTLSKGLPGKQWEGGGQALPGLVFSTTSFCALEPQFPA